MGWEGKSLTKITHNAHSNTHTPRLRAERHTPPHRQSITPKHIDCGAQVGLGVRACIGPRITDAQLHRLMSQA